jgi:hypothetical protein
MYNLPICFISLKASSWLEEEKMAKAIVHSNAGVVKDADTEFSTIIQAFKTITEIEELPLSLIILVKYVLTYYKRLAVKQRFRSHLDTALDSYLVEAAKEHATKNMLKENYRVHGSLSTVTADSIIESATSSKGKEIELEYESDNSCKSEDYHPRRTRNYLVGAVCEDIGSVSYYLYHCKSSIVIHIFSYLRQRIHT